MPRPRSLTTDAIAAAALGLVDREGLEALSMRTVASELGVCAMSLYRYVQSRDEIETLVVGEALRGIGDGAWPRLRWRERTLALFGRARDAMRRRPAILPLLLTRRHASVQTARWGEAVMAALAEGGFAGDARVLAFRTLLGYLFGAVQVEHFGPLSGSGTEALARLPPDEYPYLSATARAAGTVSADRAFRHGLDAVLTGLEQSRSARGSRRLD